jgi:hypothetical protein
VVIDDANEELLVVIAVERVSCLFAIEDDVVVRVLLVVVMEAANEVLLFVIALFIVVITNAAEELFVVTVPLRVVTDAFSDADAP